MNEAETKSSDRSDFEKKMKEEGAKIREAEEKSNARRPPTHQTQESST